MNKSKLGVMAVTFLILIFATPLVFNKLMNSKLDTMVLELNQHGYQIREIKNESSYLTTKRYYDVKIPGKLINSSIDYLEFKGFITFKNLPVTSVFMRGTLVDGKAQQYIQELINVFKNRLTLNITTPNFKVFKFRAEDINDKELVLKGLEGVYEKDNLSYSFKTFRYKNDEFDNGKVVTKKNFTLVKFSLKEDKFNAENVEVKTLYAKNIELNLSVQKIGIGGKVGVEDLRFGLDLDTNKTALKEIEKGNVKSFNYPLKLLAKLNVKNIMKLGDFHALFFLDAKNLKDIEEKVKNKNFDFLNEFVFKLKVKDSLVQFLSGMNPQADFINKLAKHKDGYTTFEVKIKDNKVSINNE